MRPVNLIPEESRRAQGAMRTGAIPFIVVGALGALLLGVVMVVLTSNEIAESEARITDLKQRTAEARREARRLQPYVDFQELAEQRTATVASLADSRFDWVRTLRQLSRVVPDDVWLTDLTAAAAPGAAPGGGGSGSAGADSIAGPSLTMTGCAKGQDAVAAFVAALKQVDGVTRVGLAESRLTDSGGGGGGSGCPPGGYVAGFDAVAAFDAAPPSAGAATAVSSTTEGTGEEGEEAEEGDGEGTAGEGEAAE